MDILINALSLIDTNSITFVVYTWATMCTIIMAAMPAILNWDNGLDYHNMNVLTDKDLEAEFFGYTMEEVEEAMELVASLHNRMVKKAVVFTLPPEIAALPTQEEANAQNAPEIPERWENTNPTEEIKWEDLFTNKEDDDLAELDELWDRIDASKYASKYTSITFWQPTQVA